MKLRGSKVQFNLNYLDATILTKLNAIKALDFLDPA
jgi:hypothetical protein